VTWEYLTVFVLAATPLVELLVVVPLGIGYGLHPVAVAVVTVAGNALPVLVIIAAFERWRAWRRGRATVAGSAADSPAEDAPRAGRWERARRIWARYGMPGLALVAPLLTGVHLAAVAALALGSPRGRIAGWMMLSIVLWTVGVTVVTVAGIEGFRHFFP
jgi:Ca2+/H+ antiporter, TMEM165/GDT1 family